MKVSIEEVEDGSSWMTIEVESAQAEKIGKAVARQASIPGFRPGRATVATVMSSLSPEDLAAAVEEVSETQSIIQQALEESDLDSSADTLLDSVEWNPMVLKVWVAGEEPEEKPEEKPADAEE